MAWFSNSNLKSKDPQRRLEAVGKLSGERDRAAINAVLAALSDGVVQVRLEALRIAASWRDEQTLRAMLHLLRDPHPAVRERAVVELRGLGSKESIPQLVSCLKDPVAAVRIQAVHALTFLGWAPQTPEERALDLIAHGHYGQAIALGDVALDLLLSFIDHPLTATRREIAEAFGRLRSSKVLLALQKLVTDQDPAVRIAAVTSLARIQAPVGALEPIIRDPDKNVRIAAVEALGELKDTEAVPALTECLKDAQWDVRCAAALALGALGQRISVPLLADGLNDPDPDVRIACAEALGTIGDVEAIQPLIIAQLDPELSVRQAGLKAIARVDYRWPRNPRAYRTLPLLKRAARMGDFAVQNSATELMERIFGIRRRALTMKSADADADRRAQASEILISCLWDDNPLLRGAAAETLGLLRSRRAADVLRVMTEDDNAWVRGCAAASLKRLDMADKAAAGGWQPSAGSNSAAA